MAKVYDFEKFDKSVTMIVAMKLTKKYLIRKWMAIKLIKLAANILGCGIEVIDPEVK